MAYCTQKDLYKRLPEADVKKLSEDNEYISAELIDEAGRLIDLHLSYRYAVPLMPVPAIVKDWVVDITIYLLAARAAIPLWQQTDDGRVENTVIVKRYADAVKMLEKIRDGYAYLPGVTAISDGAAMRVNAKVMKFRDISEKW